MRYKTNAPKQIAISVSDFVAMLGEKDKTSHTINMVIDAVYKHSVKPGVYGMEYLNFWLLYGFYKLLRPNLVIESQISSHDFENTKLPTNKIAMVYKIDNKPNAVLITLPEL